jgi:hypothetical protein
MNDDSRRRIGDVLAMCCIVFCAMMERLQAGNCHTKMLLHHEDVVEHQYIVNLIMHLEDAQCPG